MTLLTPHLRSVPHRQVRSLRADTRGALLVAGVAMGILLVGALYNIVSVGDAILWRERLQDTADAAAFESSVWHARGMNIIVFLNILMSAAMAILVALRGVIILTSVLLGALYAASAACALAWIPSGITQALCALSVYGPRIVEPANRWAIQTERRVTPRVNTFIEKIQLAQQVVATVTPLIAAKESALRNAAEYDMPALALSPDTLLPTYWKPQAVLAPSERESMVRIGRGLSLPVSLDGDWKLCEKAGGFVPNELMGWLAQAGVSGGVLDAAGGFIRKIAGGITGSLPSMFCGKKSPSEIASLQDVIRQSAEDACSAAEKKGQVTSEDPEDVRDKFGRFQGYWQRQSPIVVDSNGQATAYRFDADKCKKDEIARQNQEYSVSRGFKSARVWRYTMNGDLFMQSWGFAYDAPSRLAPDDRGISFVEGGSAAHLEHVDASGFGLERFSFAQSEMYHDCTTAWSDCGGDAMWKMRWKARLRRAQNPLLLAQRSVANIAQAELVNGIHRALVFLGGVADKRLGTMVGQSGSGGPLELIVNVLRGNLWDTAYFNRGRVLAWDPIGSLVRVTVTQHLRKNPPAPGEQFIH